MTITKQELAAAKRAAYLAARKWHAVEIDEIDATLRLWLVENQQHLERWRNEAGGEAKLAASLWRAAHTACAREHRAIHHHPDGEHYTLIQLQRLLPLLWEKDTWTQTVVADDTQTGDRFDEALTMLLDVDAAYHALPADARNLLAWRYHDGLTWQQVAERSGLTTDGARMACSRALTRLHRSLGGDGRYRVEK